VHVRPAHLQGTRLVVAFVGLMIGNTMSGLVSTIVATAAPTIVADLGSLSLLPWLATSYLLTQIGTMPVYGKLGDLYGRKRVFLVAVGVFVGASVLCGLAQSLFQLVVFRAMQGAGAGGLTGLAMAIVADITPPEKQGRFLGYAGLVFAVTSTIGPLAGGLFVDHLSWRWAFFVNVPSAVVSVAIVSALVPSSPSGPRRSLDVLGAAMLAGITTSTVLVLSWGGVEHDWGSPVILGLAGAAVGLLVAFAWHERRVPEPVLPLRVFRERQVGVAVACNLLAGTAFFGGIVFLPVFFQAVTGQRATMSGLLLVPLAVSTALSTVVVGEVVDRVGGAKAFPVAGMLSAAGGFVVLGRLDASTSAGEAAAAGLLIGIGVGFVMQVLLLVVQRSVDRADLGVATSTTVLGRILGGALGVALLGTVFNRSLATEVAARTPPGSVAVAELQGDPGSIAALSDRVRDGVVDAFAAALATTFRAAVPVMLVGFVVALLLPSRVLRARLRATVLPERPGGEGAGADQSPTATT
jgi:EmrB/QacA subfamily drug resistance transporter